MNVLKHGSKLVSVGLLSLSMSAGFSGLAFAQTGTPELFVTPNPVVLDNSDANTVTPGYDSFAVVAEGTNLEPETAYVVADDIACTGDTLNGLTEVANNDGRVTFAANETGCVPGTYTVTLRTPTAQGSQVSTAILTVLAPGASTVTTPPVTTSPVTPPPVTTLPVTPPITRPFPGPFNGTLTPGQLNGTTTGPFAGLTPAQIREAFEGANGTNSAAPTGFSGSPAGAALPARPARPTVAAGLAGRPTGAAGLTGRSTGLASRPTGAAGLTGRSTGLASRPTGAAGLTGRSGRTSRSTTATTATGQSSDELLLELVQSVLQ
jgi:hypothetical protein